MRPISLALEERLRRPDSPVRIIPVARVVEKNADDSLRAHIRQRKDQWDDADSTVGLDLLDSGDVRLHDTVATLASSTTHPNSFSDLNRTTPYDVLAIEWSGTHPNDVELARLKLWLIPRSNGALNREVVTWKIEVMHVAKMEALLDANGATRTLLTLAPLCDAVSVAVTGDSAGEVTFDFSTLPVRPKPKSLGTERIIWVSPDGTPAAPPGFYVQNPVTLVFVYALKADGSAAANVGLGYDGGVASAGAGPVIRGRHLLDGGLYLNGFTGYEDNGAAAGTPHAVVESGTYTSDEIVFSSGNLFDLGGAPTGDVQLVLRGATPPGTSLVGQVRNDADSGWVTFTDGQWMIADLGLVPTQTRKMRCDLLTNGAGNLTPTLQALGMEAISEVDLGYISKVTGGDWGIDPVTLKGEIPEVTITAIRDGLRDYRDAMTDLLANNHIGNIRFSLYWGDRTLSRKDWLHIDDALIDGSHPRGADISLTCLSPLCLLRDLVPRYEPGEVVAPDGDNTVGAWTTDSGGVTNLYQKLDEATADDTDYVRSEVNPASSQYILTLGTPVDPVGRKHLLDYRYQKDSTDTLDLTVELRQGTTVIASATHTNIPAEPTAASFSLTDAQVATITDYTDLRVRFVASKTAGAGSTRARVTWVRFRTGGKREELVYTNQTLKAVYDDLLDNALALDARYRGPGVSDAVTTVTKTLTDPSDRGKPTSKAEVDAIAYLAGGGVISSQGRIRFAELYGTRPVRAIFPSQEIHIESAGPGYAERVPEFFVKWNWNPTAGKYDDEARCFHAGALLNLGAARLNPPLVLDDEVSKWIASESLANTVGTRQVGAIGPGLLDWRFVSMYPYPELEPGDLVLVQTDQFVARDPNAGRALRGMQWAAGVVRSVDVSARRFAVWIRNYADIGAESIPGTVLGGEPDISSLALSVSATNLVTLTVGCVAGRSVRVATSLSTYPSKGTTQAATVTVLDAEGNATIDLGAIAPLSTMYVSALPYERSEGVGAEGALRQAQITAQPIPATTKVIFLTSGTSWTVPGDFNAANNSIQGIGGGGGGCAGRINTRGGGGGGGGEYRKITNFSPGGATVAYVIGQGGLGGFSGDGAAGADGTDTTFNVTSLVAKKGIGSAGLAGGAGGTGGTGAAANFDGGAGGSGSSGVGNRGGGVGGGGGGTTAVGGTGTAGSGANGGAGGAGGATSGGAGGTVPSGTGGAGTVFTSNPGGTTAGAGGGGGGGTGPASSPGGLGGLYGGGGGGGCSDAANFDVGGNGRQGLIVITYTTA